MTKHPKLGSSVYFGRRVLSAPSCQASCISLSLSLSCLSAVSFLRVVNVDVDVPRFHSRPPHRTSRCPSSTLSPCHPPSPNPPRLRPPPRERPPTLPKLSRCTSTRPPHHRPLAMSFPSCSAPCSTPPSPVLSPTLFRSCGPLCL